jgi:hypothetical protein
VQFQPWSLIDSTSLTVGTRGARVGPNSVDVGSAPTILNLHIAAVRPVQLQQLPSLHWHTWTQGSHTSRWEAGAGKLMTVR